MAGELLGKVTLTALSAGAVIQGINALFNYNILTSFIPDYAKWIYAGIGALGAWTLYGMYKK